MSRSILASLTRRTLRQEQLYSLQNKLMSGTEPKIALAVLMNHVSTAKAIEFRKRVASVEGSSFKYTPLGIVRKVVGGTKFAPLEPLLAGRVSLLISPNPVAATKVALEFNKKYPQQFLLLGGCYEGNPLNQSLLKQISEMPEDKQARQVQQFTQLCQLIQNPTMGFYQALNSYSKKWIGGMLRVKQHIAEQEKKQASGDSKDGAPAAVESKA